MAEVKWDVTLSVTETNNIGEIKPRQNNENSEVIRVALTRNGLAYDLTALTVFFVTHFNAQDNLKNPIQKEAKVIDAKNGIFEFVFDNDCMQKAGKQEAYFEVYDYDKFLDASQRFLYNIQSSSRQMKADFTPYIETWEEAEKMLDEGTAKVLNDKTNRLELQKANTVDVDNKLQKKTDNETFVAITADMQRQIESTQSGFIGDFNSEKELKDMYPDGKKGYAVVWLSETVNGEQVKVGYSYTFKNGNWVKGQVFNGLALGKKAVKEDNLDSDLSTKAITNNYGGRIREDLFYDKSLTENLFDRNSVKQGFYLIDGKLSKTTNGMVTDYIRLKGGQEYYATYTFSTIAGGIFDLQYSFIKNFITNGSKTFTPEKDCFLILNVSGNISELTPSFVICKGNKPTQQTSSRIGSVDGLVVDIQQSTNIILPEQTDSKILNIFNYEESTKNQYVDNLGVIKPHTTLCTTRKIKIRTGEKLGCNKNYNQAGVYLDFKGNFIESIKLNSDGENWFTQLPPKNAATAILNFFDYSANDFVVSFGNKPEVFTKYAVIPKGLPMDIITPGKLEGKNIFIGGDSITWLDGENLENVGKIIGFQEQFRKAGANITSHGRSGATYRLYSELSNREHGSLYKDFVLDKLVNFSMYDIIVLFAGTNDVGVNLVTGDLNNLDPKTTIGALSLIVEYILNQNPNAKIYIFGPIQSTLESRPKNKMIEVTKAIESVANEYSIPFKNMYLESNINRINVDYYLYDKIHPNNSGHENIGSIMVKTVISN